MVVFLENRFENLDCSLKKKKRKKKNFSRKMKFVLAASMLCELTLVCEGICDYDLLYYVLCQILYHPSLF